MALRREHKGVEGYFYNCGNKKLNVESGLIDRAWYHAPGRGKNLTLGILKNSHRSFVFEIWDEKDIASLYSDFGVSSAKELMKLPLQERLILVYSNNSWNFGISLKTEDVGPRYGRLRI